MKTNFFYIYSACIIVLISVSSCNHFDKKEKRMQVTIDSLHNIILSQQVRIQSDTGIRKESEPITDEDANRFINAYRATVENGIPEAWLFDKQDILYLAGHSAYGIRFYAGINDDSKLTMIGVPVDAAMNDITGNHGYDFAQICPVVCSVENDINRPAKNIKKRN